MIYRKVVIMKKLFFYFVILFLLDISKELASGLYIYKMQTADYSLSKKMLLVK
jgi:hypothetical protein